MASVFAPLDIVSPLRGSRNSVLARVDLIRFQSGAYFVLAQVRRDRLCARTSRRLEYRAQVMEEVIVDLQDSASVFARVGVVSSRGC